MSFQLKTLLKHDEFLVVDIWTFRVKALVCDIQKWEIRVRWSADIRQNRRHIISGLFADLKGISDTIRKAVTLAGERAGIVPSAVFVCVNSHSFVSEPLSMNYIRSEPSKPLSMEEIDTIMMGIESRAFDRAKTKFSLRSGIDESEMKLLASTIVSISVDGRALNNPIGFTGSQVRSQVLNVFMPNAEYLEYKTLFRDLNLEVLSYIPTPLVLPKLLWDNTVMGMCACIDVWFSKTSIVCEHRGEILWFETFRFWSEDLERAISEENPAMNHLERERFLQDPEKLYRLYPSAVDNFYSLFFEYLHVACIEIIGKPFIKQVMISWGFVNPDFLKRLSVFFREMNHGVEAEIIPCIPFGDSLKSNLYTPAFAVASAAKEVLLFQTNPLTRLLRSIVYRYE